MTALCRQAACYQGKKGNAGMRKDLAGNGRR